MNSPLRSSPQCYRSRVEMLTMICVDTYGQRGGLGSLSTVKDKKKRSNCKGENSPSNPMFQNTGRIYRLYKYLTVDSEVCDGVLIQEGQRFITIYSKLLKID